MDQRRAYRVSCSLPNSVLSSGGIGCVTNISLGGCFFETVDRANDVESLSCSLAGSGPIALSAEVVRAEQEGVGLKFVNASGKAERQIRRLVAELNSFSGHLRDARLRKELDVELSRDKTAFVLKAISASSSAITILNPHHSGTMSGHLLTQQADQLVIVAPQHGFRPADELYIMFSHGFQSHSFSSSVLQATDDQLTIAAPSAIQLSDRRAAPRLLESSCLVTFEFEDKIFHGKCLDRGDGGISLAPRSEGNWLNGAKVRNVQLLDDQHVETIGDMIVRHVSHDGTRTRLGLSHSVEQGLLTERFVNIEVDPLSSGSLSHKIRQAKAAISYGLRSGWSKLKPDVSHVNVVRFPNARGRSVAAILDHNSAESNDGKTPVVIVVPAYASRKETTCALAQTLLHNFDRQDKSIAVLRLDGVNNLGESDKDPGCWEDGKQTLHYTISDCRDDLIGAIKYAKDNPHFRASDVIVVSVSFSSIATRVAFRDINADDVARWIVYMGAADIQNAIMNVSGNYDGWGKYLRGIPNNFVTLQGCVVDGDRFCRDADELQAATLDDARRDFAKIAVPVTWISGKHDAWMDPDRVREVMSGFGPEDRLLLTVNAGHTPTSSREALAQFQLVAELVWKELHSEDFKPVEPPLGRLAHISKTELDRVRSQRPPDREYWQRYLIGEDRIGYDILRQLPAYREFAELQARLADSNQAEVLDLGSGTGIVTHALVKQGARHVICVDLIDEALARIPATVDNAGTGVELVVADVDDPPLPIQSERVDAVVASLLLSYLRRPSDALAECYRVLRPGGRLVISSMKPDADTSVLFQEFIGTLEVEEDTPHREEMLEAARGLLNRAGTLFRLEREGVYRFFTEQELVAMVCDAGFENATVSYAYGTMPQAVVVACRKPVKET